MSVHDGGADLVASTLSRVSQTQDKCIYGTHHMSMDPTNINAG